MDPHCKNLSSPSIINFIFSIIILVGILLSYVPQHVRIIARRSSFGISPYFVLLGTTSGTCGFVNILLLPRSAKDIGCCKEINGFSCFAGLLGIFQVGVQAASFVIILFLFIIFFPRPNELSRARPSPESPTFRTALVIAIICITHAIASAVLGSVIAIAHPSYRQLWANIFGIAAAILSSIQYFPQIYTTFRLRRVGSLSIPMMCIQTPGGFIWAASLASRLGPEGWSTWGVYVVIAFLQGVLLVMSIYFEYISPRDGKTDPTDESVEPAYGNEAEPESIGANQDQVSEETPLLQNQRKD